jgi:hypothetical protein
MAHDLDETFGGDIHYDNPYLREPCIFTVPEGRDTAIYGLRRGW